MIQRPGEAMPGEAMSLVLFAYGITATTFSFSFSFFFSFPSSAEGEQTREGGNGRA